MSSVKKLISPTMPDIEVPKPPAVPTVDDARTAAESRDQMLRRRGRRSTILTGEGGTGAGTVAKTTLIGS
jgi:hypothetical protein